jgi:hypothetical protein
MVQQKRHWLRKIESVVILVFSLLFAIGSGCTIGWYFSTLNAVTAYQPIVTIIVAVAFSGFGFVLSRSLAYRMQHSQPKGLILLAVLVYEVVEIGACFSEAADGIRYMTWITDGGFTGLLFNVLSALPYVILSILPVFTVLCGQLDISLHIEKHGQEAPSAQPAPGVQRGFAPLPSAATRFKPSSAPPPAAPAQRVREVPQEQAALYPSQIFAMPSADGAKTEQLRSQEPAQVRQGGRFSLPFLKRGEGQQGTPSPQMQPAEFPEMLV